ncbi:hypothetical protein C8N37_101151 [Sphingobacterium faecium]|jgi:hypothetical protein|nr:hypothetical protein C8N37_101151 [Sphingobacterium faecium]
MVKNILNAKNRHFNIDIIIKIHYYIGNRNVIIDDLNNYFS